jgi:predicted SAM-dependent methyltransferase
VVNALSPTRAAILRLGIAFQLAFQRHPLPHRTVLLGLRTAGLVRRPRQLERCFNEVPPQKRCLSIGSGFAVADGWLCTDLAAVRRGVVYLDATRRWPMSSASFRYITCEHMIEHVPYEAGLQVISEAHRVLQRDGVLRITTPNLDVIRLLPDSDDPDVQDYIRWFNRTFGSAAQRAEEASPVHAINLMMHEFGHIHLYDEGTLRRVLTRAGFRQAVRCEPRMSRHAELVGVDWHADTIPDTFNRVEALILEATA